MEIIVLAVKSGQANIGQAKKWMGTCPPSSDAPAKDSGVWAKRQTSSSALNNTRVLEPSINDVISKRSEGGYPKGDMR